MVITSQINGDSVDFDIMQFVESYRLHGGPEQPIRYIVIEVSKLNIDNVKGTIGGVATDYTLLDNIVQGQSKLYVHGIGTGTFIITKIQLNDYLYRITAYGVEVLLNSTVLTSSVIQSIMGSSSATQLVGTTSWIACQLLTYWNENIATGNLATEYKVHLSSSFDTASPGGTYSSTGTMVAFESGMTFLSIMNVCALIDNAFIFFGDEWDDTEQEYLDTFYFVNYDDSLPIASNPASKYSTDGFRKGVSMDGVVNIYPPMDDPYEYYSATDLLMYDNVVALASQTSEGADTIVNSQTVIIYDENNVRQEIVNDDASIPGGTSEEYTGASHSITAYGEYANASMNLERMRGVFVNPDTGYVDSTPSLNTHYNIEDTAKKIANNMVRRYRDSSQSIVIMMGEATDHVSDNITYTVWNQMFSQYSHANYINDDVNDIHLEYFHQSDKAFFEENTGYTNMSKDNSLLRLSTYTYCYPEMATQYRFGVAKQVDLTQTLASLTKSKT